MGLQIVEHATHKKVDFCVDYSYEHAYFGQTSHVMNCFFAIMGFILLSPSFSFLFSLNFCLVLLCFGQFVVVLFILNLQILQESTTILFFEYVKVYIIYLDSFVEKLPW